MLAKVITLRHGTPSKGFRPALNYIMRAGAKNRLPEGQQLEGGEINVSQDELYFTLAENNVAYADDISCVLESTADECQRKGRFKGNPVYHVAINWQDGEHPSPEQARHACDHVMKALGYEEHQAAWSIHRDTDNDHVHLVINRVHPTRLLAISPPFKKDYFILDRCMRELEIEFGYGRANGPYITLDTKEGPKIVRMSRAERRERGLLKEDAQPRLTRGAAAAEHRLGEDSFQSWASKEPAQDLKKVLQQPEVTWQDVHHCLAQHGVSIQPKGSGMIVTTTLEDGRVLAGKASQMGRWASKAELEKKLGAFVPSNISFPPNHKYQNTIEERRKNHSDERKLYDKAEDGDRVIRRVAREQARKALAERFKAEQKAIRSEKPLHRAELRDRHNNEKRELLDEQRQTRAQVRSDAKKQGKSPELALSLWAYHAAIQREALQKRQAAERKAMTAMLPHSEVWRKWLESQAENGDEAAMAALRGIRYREQRVKTKSQDGIEGEELDPLCSLTVAQLDAQLDRRRQLVVYTGKDGRVRFTDTGPRIVMHDKGDDSLEAALRIASQKYGGKVDITGSSEFRERATREATRLGIRVLNGDLQGIVQNEVGKNRKPKNSRPDHDLGR
ncbi:TraI/MobA(P) family conjugative relaxase [Ferrovum myxofaciens]|uniref:TraI/MobA(P) family conjugative relaxase n=1 Tax=Ferrovum myxofaciens TaxID=416213 RepID=UPI00068D6FEC|nr:TraI/MobA(P) family conjugative relaxase [Ferrovum myxofaciens]